MRIDPIRRPYDLRHTYATFALRAGISIFDLSRFMGASLAMIDKHYGHLACDGRDHAVACWTPPRTIPPRGRHVDVAAELPSPLGDSGCSLANSLTFGAVDISSTSPLQNVFFTENERCLLSRRIIVAEPPLSSSLGARSRAHSPICAVS